MLVVCTGLEVKLIAQSGLSHNAKTDQGPIDSKTQPDDLKLDRISNVEVNLNATTQCTQPHVYFASRKLGILPLSRSLIISVG